MYKLGIGLLLILGLLLAPQLAGADFKVGIIDGMDIVGKSAAGKSIQESLKRKGEELGRPIEAKRKDLARMLTDFEKQASVMKEDAKKKKEEEINKKVEELRKQGAEAEKELTKFQEKELAPLFQKLEQAVNDVAKEMKLDAVFDKRNSGLMFINPSLDITEKVRAKFAR
jgi:outer membrane protein